MKNNLTIENHVAYEDKDIDAIKSKHHEYRVFRNFFDSFESKIEPQTCQFLIYPEITNIEQLDDLIHRICFALPEDDHLLIIFPVSKTIDSSIVNRINAKHKHIECTQNYQIQSLINKSIMLFYDMSKLDDLELFRSSRGAEIIDKNYFSDVEAETLRKLYYKSLSPEKKQIYDNQSKNNFIKFKEINRCKKKAFCFTSGPSFDNYKNFNYSEDSLKIICNSIVKNKDFLDYVKGVDVLTFADPVFHFGASQYAEKFRKDVLKFVKNSEVFIVIPEINVPLMLKHYPELKSRLIGLGGSNIFNFPSHDNLVVKNTSNILTLLMIPIASAISDYIFIIGADGRKEDEKYFWKHSSSAQYDSKMEDAFKMHPSFFRDRNYSDYYTEHCRVLESLISYGESLGKVYGSITRSYIPVLQERWIDMNQSKDQLCIELEVRREKNRANIDKRIENDRKSINNDFAQKMNILYTYIDRLQESKKKLAVYGNGLIGKIIARELKKQLVVIFDQNADSYTEVEGVYHPSKMSEFVFDTLIITVLGREDEIIELLSVDKQKVFTIDLTKKAERILFIDTKSPEYSEENLCGPFTRESRISFDETYLISEYIQQGSGIMIDVGAHFGLSSKTFLDKGWLVYGYEPDPENYLRIEENLKDYQKFILSEKAVSDIAGQIVDFYTSKESTGISGLFAFTDGHQKTSRVKTTTLADELHENSILNVDFLKIDTEGYDLFVLRGFAWNKCKPLIIECEFEDKKTLPLGYTVYELIQFLVDRGYYIYISQWHSIVKYGIRHEWKRFFKYKNHSIDTNSWGNILAFSEIPDENELVKKLHELINLRS